MGSGGEVPHRSQEQDVRKGFQREDSGTLSPGAGRPQKQPPSGRGNGRNTSDLSSVGSSEGRTPCPALGLQTRCCCPVHKGLDPFSNQDTLGIDAPWGTRSRGDF
ncbi:hypothetical protein NPIL_568451 [Nephila pilipes]|uniref:Uncharacterized protein n=1 Tax=Nephila pilipes TaxID=299642 RepID=A0A8X6UG52_NEPPI|nr:hypothetical protein NPIL_568451 [Nephila pilipes]